MESAPAAGGNRYTRLVLLLVWFAKAHPSPKDCELARSKNAKRSRGTGSGSGTQLIRATSRTRIWLWDENPIPNLASSFPLQSRLTGERSVRELFPSGRAPEVASLRFQLREPRTPVRRA